jgi:predicted NAD/FAD-dependent oxidoreductase
MEGRAPEGATQMTVLARDAFAARWAEMADDVVAKNLLSSLEIALPGVGNRLKSTLLGRARAPFFGVGSYRRIETFQKVQADRRSLGRRLYWAGDYLTGPTLESASLSGLRAARECAKDLAETDSLD